MKVLILFLSAITFLSCSAQKPTKADIEKALRGTWDRAQTSSDPKQSVTIHSIKIGTGAKANLQDKIDGIPAGSTVTIVQIDFTTRQYYNDQTIATHRIMNAKVFKDQFGEWTVMSNGMKTSDTKYEPKG